jgi:hypothetical protein
MIRLYTGSGSWQIELVHPYPDEEWNLLRHHLVRLLIARKQDSAAGLLENLEFKLWAGTNDFHDEFDLLYSALPLSQYVEAAHHYEENKEAKAAAKVLSDTLKELTRSIRFVAFEMATDDGIDPVPPPAPQITSRAVERALSDAESLLSSTGPSSAVDRVHTALHGYLHAVLRQAGMSTGATDSLTSLFKHLRTHHSVFTSLGPHEHHVGRLISTMAAGVDALNTIRNQASSAHPNIDVLGEDEAMLAVNFVRTLLHYLDAKLGR